MNKSSTFSRNLYFHHHSTMLNKLLNMHLACLAGSCHFMFLDFVGARGTRIVSMAHQLGHQVSREKIHPNIPATPQFIAGFPSCGNPPNLSRLGTGMGFCWFLPSDCWISDGLVVRKSS